MTKTRSVKTERPSLDSYGLLSSRSIDLPIAIGLPQFAPNLADGSSVAESPAEVWYELLNPVLQHGFDSIEIPTQWMPLHLMRPSRVREFFEVLSNRGLNPIGISLARASIIESGKETENLAAHHRIIDVAAEYEVPFVCMGLHQPLRAPQKRALWFWDEPGPKMEDDPQVYGRVVDGFKELGQHAHDVGVEVSLEIYEDTYLGSADGAVQLLTDIDEQSVGLNPDIGNLIRLNRPVDSWEYMMHTLLPHANYWHVKNYARTLAGGHNGYVTFPTSLQLGMINYRSAVSYALALGYCGPLVVEHYGGDSIGVSALNRDYLSTLLGSLG